MAVPTATGKASPIPATIATSNVTCPLVLATAAGSSAASRPRLNTAAYANHLSCSRSSPADRRYLANKLAAASSRHIPLRVQTANEPGADRLAEPRTPVGLGTLGSPVTSTGAGSSQV